MAAYWPISALSVPEKLVYRFRFLAICCLACFSKTRFMLSFASRVEIAPISESLRLRNGAVGLRVNASINHTYQEPPRMMSVGIVHWLPFKFLTAFHKSLELADLAISHASAQLYSEGACICSKVQYFLGPMITFELLLYQSFIGKPLTNIDSDWMSNASNPGGILTANGQ